MAILSEEQLLSLGFKSIGNNVRISDKVSIYNPENISLGDNVRIDDFAVLSAGIGGIDIGSYVHIAVYSSLIGAGTIKIADFANVSSRVSIYSSSDDYSGETMTNPMVANCYKNVYSDDVLIRKHVIIGSGSVILPGVVIGDGVAIGALSLVNKSCEDFSIYAGIPAKFIKQRKKNILELESNLIRDTSK